MDETSPSVQDVSLSDEGFASFSCSVTFGDIGLARDHGLPHAGNIRATNVRSAVHFAICNDALPWVGAVALLDYALVVSLLAVFVLSRSELNLLLSVLVPLNQFFAALSLALSPFLILLFLFLE